MVLLMWVGAACGWVWMGSGGKMGKKLVAKPRLCPEPYVFTMYAAAT